MKKTNTTKKAELFRSCFLLEKASSVSFLLLFIVARIFIFMGGLLCAIAISSYFGLPIEIGEIPHISGLISLNALFLFGSGGVLLICGNYLKLCAESSLRKLSVNIEQELKSRVINNLRLSPFNRQYFQSEESLFKEINRRYIKSRTLVRVYRAQLSIFPELLLGLGYISVLLYLSVYLCLILTLFFFMFALFNRYHNEKVSSLEKEYLKLNEQLNEKRREKFKAVLNSREEESNRILFEKDSATSSFLYFSRSFLADNAAVTMFSMLSLCILIIIGAETYFGLGHFSGFELNDFLLILFSGRGLISALSQLSSSAAVIQKYYYHGKEFISYLTTKIVIELGAFTGYNSIKKKHDIEVVGPRLNRYSISLYLNEVIKHYSLNTKYIKSVYNDLDRQIFYVVMSDSSVIEFVVKR